MLRREPHTLLLHLQAEGDVLPRVRCVVCSMGTGVCTCALFASTAFGVSGSLLTDS